MKNPLVSVITSVYNGELYLWESLKSIYDQNFKDYEFILINDGSEDNTSHLLYSFKFYVEFLKGNSDNIIFIDHKNNKKIPIRRNEAINMARGDYIAIHDADDISLPDRLLKQVDFLEKNKDVFCVGGHAIEIDELGRKIGQRIYSPFSTNEIIDIITDKKQFVLNPIIDPTTMFRKKDFLELGGYTLREDIYTVPDYDLWLKAILNDKKIFNLQEYLIKYRKHEKSVTEGKKKEMIRAHMLVWTKFMKMYNRKLGY